MFIKVFFDENVKPDAEKAKLAVSLCQASSLHIKLPDHIEVHFSLLEENIYATTPIIGGINRRIIVNYSVPIEELIYPITHELLHIEQLYMGKLSVSRTGLYIWEGQSYSLADMFLMNHASYENLPWEQDVLIKQPALIGQILG